MTLTWHQAFNLLEMLQVDEKDVSTFDLEAMARCKVEEAREILEKLEERGLCTKVRRPFLSFKNINPPIWRQTEKLKSMSPREIMDTTAWLSNNRPHVDTNGRGIPSVPFAQKEKVG